MRTRPEHQEAVTRRLALLRAQIEAEALPRAAGQEWWDGHTHPGEEELAPVVPLPTAQPEPVPVPVEPAPVLAPVPVVVPVPGRHAARRPARLIEVTGSWLPETLRGRIALGHGQLTVVALLVAGALALTSWWLVRARATTIAAPSLPAAAASALAPLPATAARPSTAPVAASASASAMVTVDVEGRVRHPGIVIVPAGSRVTDALAAAGGVRRHTALGGINLAAVLIDGQQIVVGAGAVSVPAAGSPGGTAGAGSSAGSGSAGSATLVNLNTASADQLDTLPGVGPVTAQAILEWREQNGAFTSVQELLEVNGIGPATLEKLTPHVTV